jgi:tripartite-type tricarboxylate transporter receptor subunit TctC
MKKIAAVTSFVMGAALCIGAVHAQTYPTKPVTMIVPFAAGGTADVMGRVFGLHLSKALGQNVIFEIKAGAGSMIGSQYVAKTAQPDGYTFLLTGNPIAINVALMDLAFDPRKDLIPVAGVVGFSLVMITSESGSLKSVADVIKASKGGNLTFGSSGPGTISHLSGELFKSLTNVDLTHVPYKGSGAVYPDLISGRVSLLFDVSGSAIGYIKNGKVRPLGVTSTQRSKALPNVPTLAEQGVSGYEALAWFGVFLPAGTPPAVVSVLEKAVNKVVQLPEFAARLNEWGGYPLPAQSAEDFERYYRAEVQRWEGLVREGRVKRLN